VKDRATRAVFFGVWAGTYAAGVWWIFLGVLLLFGRTRRAMGAIFAPFLRNVSRKWAVIGLVVGLLLLLLATAAAIAAQRWNHVYF